MSARGLVVDDNSLVREALRFMPTHLELQVVYLHQRAIAPAPMDDLRSACALQTVPSRIARRTICAPVESRELICQVET